MDCKYRLHNTHRVNAQISYDTQWKQINKQNLIKVRHNKFFYYYNQTRLETIIELITSLHYNFKNVTYWHVSSTYSDLPYISFYRLKSFIFKYRFLRLFSDLVLNVFAVGLLSRASSLIHVLLNAYLFDSNKKA